MHSPEREQRSGARVCSRIAASSCAAERRRAGRVQDEVEMSAGKAPEAPRDLLGLADEVDPRLLREGRRGALEPVAGAREIDADPVTHRIPTPS